MKSILTKIQILSFLCALPALANDVGLHNGSAQPTRAAASEAIMLAGNTQKQITPAIVRKIEGELQAPDWTCIDVGNEILAMQNNSKTTGTSFSPGLAVAGQLANFGIKVLGPMNVRVTQQPKHGTIIVAGTNTDELAVPGSGSEAVTTERYFYTPDKTYQGTDKVTFEVKANGYTFRMSLEFHVLSQYGGPDQCPTGAEDEGSLQVTPGSIELIASDSADPLPENMQALLRNEQMATYAGSPSRKWEQFKGYGSWKQE